MKITHKIKMDLARPGTTPRVPVVQKDTYTRELSIALYSDRRPWRIPSDASVVINYRKPDRTSGTYDTLSDGSRAVNFSGNTVNILIAPEALSLAGTVTLMVTIFSGEERLSTFSMELEVAPDCTSGWTDEEEAAWIAAFLPSPDNAEPGQHFAVDKVDEAGHVLSVKPVDLAEWLENYLDENSIAENVSISHEWDGTILTVTSASGTSSADLKGEPGADGKSAYEYAIEAGYKGTEAAFAEQLALGGAEEITISSTMPENENVKVWINPDEEGETCGSSASMDVTAEVGQTIIVKAVDGNGKPTQWESAEYQPRTHWTDETVVLPEISGKVDEYGALIFSSNFVPTLGGKYTVMYNGVEYVCECEGVDGEYLIGNVPMIMETGDNGMPFIVVVVTGTGDGTSEKGVVPLDGATSITVSIKELKITPIPVQYVSNAFPYYIAVSGNGTTADPYVCNDTVANVAAIYNSGRTIVARIAKRDDTNGYTAYEFFSLIYTMHMDTGHIILAFSKAIKSGSTVQTSMLFFVPQEDGTYAASESLNG